MRVLETKVRQQPPMDSYIFEFIYDEELMRSPMRPQQGAEFSGFVSDTGWLRVLSS